MVALTGTVVRVCVCVYTCVCAQISPTAFGTFSGLALSFLGPVEVQSSRGGRAWTTSLQF